MLWYDRSQVCYICEILNYFHYLFFIFWSYYEGLLTVLCLSCIKKQRVSTRHLEFQVYLKSLYFSVKTWKSIKKLELTICSVSTLLKLLGLCFDNFKKYLEIIDHSCFRNSIFGVCEGTFQLTPLLSDIHLSLVS